MEQTATAPATSNTIGGAEQSGNIAEQRFARMVEMIEAFHDNLGGRQNKW